MPGSAEILDLGSANGITLNDGPVTRGAWLPGDRLRIGDTVLGIEFASAPLARPGRSPPARRPAPTRGRRVQPVAGDHRQLRGRVGRDPGAARGRAAPALPRAGDVRAVLLGVVLFAYRRRPRVAPHHRPQPADDGRERGRGPDGRRARQQGLDGGASPRARRARPGGRRGARRRVARPQRRAPADGPLPAAAAQRLPRCCGPAARARRGSSTSGSAPPRLDSRLRFETQRNRRAVPAAQAELDNLVARYRSIGDVPFTLSLTEHGAIGIAGDPGAALDVTRAVLCQLAALHSPAEVVLAAFCGGRSAPDWDWLKWLPHTSSAHSPLTGPHLVAGPSRRCCSPSSRTWCARASVPAGRRHRRLRCRGPAAAAASHRRRHRRRGTRARRQPRPR